MRSGLIGGLISAVLYLLVLACGSTSVSEVASPDVVRCSATVSGSIPTVPASGGSVPVTVGAARECSWTASSDVSWMQVAPASGQGQAPVTLTMSANPAASTRSATLIVNNQRFSVSQAAAPCAYTLNTTSAHVDAAGGSVSVRVTAPSGCGWTVSSAAPWIHVPQPSASGEATVGLAIDQNAGDARSGQVTIAGQPFTIAQDAFVGPPPTPAPSPGPTPAPAPSPSPAPSPAPSPSPFCTYALSSYSKDFGDKAGGGDFKVNTADGCAWSAASNADWITIVSGASGVGSGPVKYSVDTNRSDQLRIGTITVVDQVYTITQKGH